MKTKQYIKKQKNLLTKPKYTALTQTSSTFPQIFPIYVFIYKYLLFPKKRYFQLWS